MARPSADATRVNVYFPNEILKKVDARCKELCMTRSSYVVMALNKQLESEDLSRNLPELLSVLNRAIDESKRINSSSV